jgi:hypothetical protein
MNGPRLLRSSPPLHREPDEIAHAEFDAGSTGASAQQEDGLPCDRPHIRVMPPFDYELRRGDVVRIASRSLSGPGTGGDFTVLSAYPVEYMEPVYRIRSIRTRDERMVPGSKLRLSNVPLSAG